MSERWVFGVTLVAAIGAGVMSGLFFVFSNFMMRVLDKRPPNEAVATMNSINELIVNPLFVLVFTATALASAVLAGYAIFANHGPERTWLIVGGVVYVVGCFLLTAGYHIPRNDALAKVDPDSAEAAGKWANYMSEWVPLNHVRTLASVVALASFVMAVRVG